MSSFAHLGLPAPLVDALARHSITTPFPVQEAAIPDALEGHDICGKAPTGSGKTLAFGLPMLASIGKAKRGRPTALVLAPTRELADQIHRDLLPLSKSVGRHVTAVYGGVGYGPQKTALRRGVDVLVATPGRLEDLLEQRVVDLGAVEVVVVDEADRMADMGFLPAVRRLLDLTPSKRQTMLFSATLDGDIAVLSRDYQQRPVRHEAASIEPKTSDARHLFWSVQHEQRVSVTAEIVAATDRSIIFTRTRRGADRLAKQLAGFDIDSAVMHGGRSQGQRKKALKAFSTGRAAALIATDVAARGIHVEAVSTVLHYDPPADHKDYLHRAGRTARAGETGTVVSLVTPQQRRTVQGIQRELDLRIPIEAPRVDVLSGGSQRRANGSSHRTRDEHRSVSSASDRSSREPSRSHRPPKHRDERRDARTGVRKSQVPRPVERAVPSHSGRSKTGETIYIANIPWTATDTDLEKLFRPYGRVHDSTVICNNRTGRSKGFGFVEMPEGEAAAAIKGLTGTAWDGRHLTVRVAKPRTHGG